MFNFNVAVTGENELLAALTALNAEFRDMRPVWPKVSLVFDRMERDQFVGQGVGSAGGWKALSPAYAKWKAVHFPGKPILFRTGDLVRSLTSPFDENAIFDMTPDSLSRGSKLPYVAPVHALRPVIDPTEKDQQEIRDVIREHFNDLSIDLGFQVVT
jgi:phage gpG-like protein